MPKRFCNGGCTLHLSPFPGVGQTPPKVQPPEDKDSCFGSFCHDNAANEEERGVPPAARCELRPPWTRAGSRWRPPAQRRSSDEGAGPPPRGEGPARPPRRRSPEARAAQPLLPASPPPPSRRRPGAQPAAPAETLAWRTIKENLRALVPHWERPAPRPAARSPPPSWAGGGNGLVPSRRLPSVREPGGTQPSRPRICCPRPPPHRRRQHSWLAAPAPPPGTHGSGWAPAAGREEGAGRPGRQPASQPASRRVPPGVPQPVSRATAAARGRGRARGCNGRRSLGGAGPQRGEREGGETLRRPPRGCERRRPGAAAGERRGSLTPASHLPLLLEGAERAAGESGCPHGPRLPFRAGRSAFEDVLLSCRETRDPLRAPHLPDRCVPACRACTANAVKSPRFSEFPVKTLLLRFVVQ